jgi:hypothetical protein
MPESLTFCGRTFHAGELELMRQITLEFSTLGVTEIARTVCELLEWRLRERELACLLWTSPTWKMQARDAWIGWSDQQRRQNLQSLVNNGRFLILPWVQVKGLASKTLALSARQMPCDWEARYGCRPLLLETLVDAARFRGTCYQAANWVHVGQTVGRGRMDREHEAQGQAVKHIYVYPLVRDVRQRLRGDLTR